MKTKFFIKEKKKKERNHTTCSKSPKAQYFTELHLCQVTEMANRLVTARKQFRKETSSFVKMERLRII